MNRIPKHLYHYYEAELGPFKTLSDLSKEHSEKELEKIRNSGETFASKRAKDYMTIRRELERIARALFIEKGGKPLRETPISMTLGPCKWIKEWYKDGQEIKIPINDFDPNTISFTYGDIFPTMRYNDQKPYRKKVYTLEEIKKVVSIYGLPQEWNKNGENGPDRYIEVQVWCDVNIDNIHIFK